MEVNHSIHSGVDDLMFKLLTCLLGGQVRVRSAGDSGCGHSGWSKPAVVAMPDAQQGQAPSSSRINSSMRRGSSVSLDRDAAHHERAASTAVSQREDAKRKPTKMPGGFCMPLSFHSSNPFSWQPICSMDVVIACKERGMSSSGAIWEASNILIGWLCRAETRAKSTFEASQAWCLHAAPSAAA